MVSRVTGMQRHLCHISTVQHRRYLCRMKTRTRSHQSANTCSITSSPASCSGTTAATHPESYSMPSTLGCIAIHSQPALDVMSTALLATSRLAWSVKFPAPHRSCRLRHQQKEEG